MLQQVKLARVVVTNKDKKGMTLVGRNNKPYWKIAIKTEEHGDKWLSGLIFDQQSTLFKWRAGDKVSIVVEQKGQYLNFHQPNEKEMELTNLQALMDDVKMIKAYIADHATHCTCVANRKPGVVLQPPKAAPAAGTYVPPAQDEFPTMTQEEFLGDEPEKESEDYDLPF